MMILVTKSLEVLSSLDAENRELKIQAAPTESRATIIHVC